MKIVEIVFHLNSGGAERFVVDLSNELSKTNEVVLLALKEDKSNPDEFLFYKFDLSERVKYKNVGLPSYSYKPSTMWQVYKAIKADIHSCVNIGQKGGGKENSVNTPIIGNHVWIGPGAKLFGKIRIADYCQIGANSVVNKDFLLPGSVIVGCPAKTIKAIKF